MNTVINSIEWGSFNDDGLRSIEIDCVINGCHVIADAVEHASFEGSHEPPCTTSTKSEFIIVVVDCFTHDGETITIPEWVTDSAIESILKLNYK